MKTKLTLLLILWFIAFKGHSQCNYNHMIGALDSTENVYKSNSFSESSKTSIRFKNGFMFATILKFISNARIHSKTELLKTDSCGAVLNRRTLNINCSGTICQTNARVFEYKDDTAILVLSGNYLSVYKVDNSLQLTHFFTDSTQNKMVAGVLKINNGNLIFIEDLDSASAIRVYNENGSYISRYTTSANAPLGFWISYYSNNILQGHAIGNKNQILEITLNTLGFPTTDSLFGNTPIPLLPKLYSISNPDQSGKQTIAIVSGNEVSIYPYSNKTIGAKQFSQRTYNEKSFGKISSLSLLNTGELLLHAMPESFLWKANGKLMMCLPNQGGVSQGFVGGNNWSTRIENFQSLYVNTLDTSLPSGYVLHSAGEVITYGPSASGYWLFPGKLRGSRCIANDTFLSIGNLPSSISTYPTSFNFTITIPSGSEWNPVFVFDKVGVSGTFSADAGNRALITINQPPSNLYYDSLKMCVLLYNYGGLPRKICSKIPIINFQGLKQLNSNQVIQTQCDGIDTSFGEKMAPSACIALGDNVLYSSIFNCNPTGFSPKLECRLFNIAGEQTQRLTYPIPCAIPGCVEGAIPFEYAKDTALLGLYGKQGLIIYKISKDLNKYLIFSNPILVNKPREIILMNENRIVILMDSGSNSQLYIYSNSGSLISKISNGAFAPSGFWISDLSLIDGMLVAHSISKDNSQILYRINLNSNGIITNVAALNINLKKIEPFKLAVIKNSPSSNTWVTHLTAGKLNLFKIDQSNTIISLIEDYSVNNNMANYINSFSISGKQLLICTDNEIFVYDTLGQLQTCMPYRYAHYTGKGSSRILIDGKIESVFLSNETPNSESMIQYAATERVEKNGFVYSYGRQVGRIIEKNNYAEPYFYNLPSIVNTLPYKNQIYYHTTNPEFNWQTLWETNKPQYFDWKEPIANIFTIDIKDSSQLFIDTINLCAIKYVVGTTPFKSCRSIVINTFKTNLGEESTNHEFNVFPNPSSGKFQIALADPGLKGAYEVFSITGELVLSGILENQMEIDLGKNSTGVYVLRVKSNEKSLSTLLIKE